MKKLVKWTFCFEEKQLEDLKELSKKSNVPQAVFVREALHYILKKYRYFLTIKKMNAEEVRYFLTKSQGVDAPEGEKKSVSVLGKTRSMKEPNGL